MPKEPTLTDLARMLGISQLAAQRHARAAGGPRAFGGKVMDTLSHILAGGSRKRLPASLPKDVIDALNRIGQTGTAAPEAPSGGRGGGQPPRRPPGTVAPAGGDGGEDGKGRRRGRVPSFPPVEVPPPFSSRKPKPQPRTVAGRLNQPPTAEEEGDLSDEFICMSSSNVYSYQYYRQAGAATGVLFVTFRAVNLNADALSHGHVPRKGGRAQMIGKAGKTVTGGARPLVPGVKYQYFNVPPSVFSKLKDSYSKGKAVWDLLRVRGTIYGTRYAYSVASAQVTPGVGEYLPRKATKSGFRTRSLADVGSGRRGFIQSTLPASSGGGGFSTRGKRK